MIFTQGFLFCHCDDERIDALLKDYSERFAVLLREQELYQQKICDEKRQRLQEMQQKLQDLALQLNDNSNATPVDESVINRFKRL